MGTMQPRQRAVAVSAFDLPESGQLLVYGCEDCACPVTAADPRHARHAQRSAASQAGASRWIRARDARELAIDDGHWAVFNPAGDGGVVALNAAAREVLRCFDIPATQQQAQAAAAPASPDDVEAVITRLRAAAIDSPRRPARPPGLCASQPRLPLGCT